MKTALSLIKLSSITTATSTGPFKQNICFAHEPTPWRRKRYPLAIHFHQRADLNDVYCLKDRLYEIQPSTSKLTMHWRPLVSAVQIKSMTSTSTEKEQ